MLKPIKNNSLVTERDLEKYADDSMSLTLWLDEKSGILAFELVFDLLIDEWAFICHANGSEGMFELILPLVEMEDLRSKQSWRRNLKCPTQES